MAVAKILEITSSSTSGSDDAVKVGIAKAAETVQNITGAWVKDEEVIVSDGQITEWRVNLKITFILN